MACPSHLIIMGPSGVGKSTVGQALAEKLHYQFLEGDEFHSPSNVEKMRQGRALNDSDRFPWLLSVNQALKQYELAGKGVVLACSALKASYRQLIKEGLTEQAVWVYLSVDRETLQSRLAQRSNHFMPASLLSSQLLTLELPSDAVIIDGTQPLETIVFEILQRLTTSVTNRQNQR